MRWQKSNTNVGFYGLKEGIEMRRSGEKYKIDWNPFLNQLISNVVDDPTKTKEENEYDTAISGPWMKKWEIIHENKHTERLRRFEENNQFSAKP